MPQKESRLKKTKEFEEVFSKGKGFRQGGLFLKVKEGTEGGSRFGIVVSKKVSKQATARNRMRRLIREALRQEREQIKNGAEAVIVVLPEFKENDFKEVQIHVHNLLKKASLFQ
jgi:ribonuclease P protein component